MATIEISNCCQGEAVLRHGGDESGYQCSECEQACEAVEVCEYCLGEGTIATDESDGEGHIMRGVGTKKCVCQH